MEHVVIEGIRRLSCHTPTLDAIPAVATLRRVALCSVSWRLGELGVRQGRASACSASRGRSGGGSAKGEVRHRPFHFGRGIPEVQAAFRPEEVRAFYSRMTFGHGGPITSTVRGRQIHLDPESICRILDIPPGGLRSRDSEDVRPCRCPGVGQTIGP
ncbi:hypothetical protein AAG906_018261 [Vitis piasezkii]